MTISRIKRNRSGVYAVAAAIAIAVSGGAFAQQRDDRAEPDEAPEQGREQGQEQPRLPIATDRPRIVIPGPYVPKGSLKDYRGVVPGLPQSSDAGGRGNDAILEEMERLAGEGQESTLASPVDADSIEIGALGAVDPSATGVLEPERGGFPLDFWVGTPRSVIEKLMPLLPAGTRSPTTNALSRRLLLSAVALPRPLPVTGQDTAGNIVGDPMALLEARLERLLASGNLGALTQLLARVPAEQETARIRDIAAEGALLSGDVLAACEASERARATEGTAKWLKVTALCQAIAGDRGMLGMTTGLLEESGELTMRFSTLIDAVLARAEGQDVLPEIDAAEVLGRTPDALTIALFRAAGAPIPVDALDNARPAMLGAMAARSDLDIDFRVEAAEQAARNGVISPKRLADVFDAMEFTDGERASAMLLSETDLGARVDALLYHMVATSPDVHDRMRHFSAAWSRAGREDLIAALAPVLARAVKNIRPSDALAIYAHDLGRVALYAGDFRLANEWYDVAREGASNGGVEARRVLVSLWPLMFVADTGGNIPYSPQILDLWRQSQAVRLPAEQNARAALLYGILEALGTPVDATLWQDVLGAPAADARPGPSLALWRQLIVAADNDRVGEGVLLSLIALGDGGAGDVSPSALSAAVRALSALGLEAEARAIALEALVAAGF